MTDKETMAIIKQMVADGQISQEVAEKYFPELNEDEKIRKELIEYLKERKSCESYGQYVVRYDRWIAWLEKQGEQKSTLPKWKYKKDNTPLLRDSLILNKYGCVAKSPSGAIVSDVWIIDYDELAKLPKEESEKQGEQILANFAKTCKDEQKPVDKVEPKFKVGDWVVYTGYLLKGSGKEIYVMQVASVEDDRYNFTDTSTLCFDSEKDVRLWTIEDAKDGDVLCCESGWTCIFKALDNHTNTFGSYCFMDSDKWFCNTGSECHTLDKAFIKAYNREIHPATKEQLDALMKAMGNAGYTFDFEKKELRKIMQKPAEWNKEDIFTLDFLVDYLSRIIVNASPEEYIDGLARSVTLLKAIKDGIIPRPHWKPSEEQMKCLSQVKGTDDHVGYVLCTLYNDLKKLK